MWTFGLCERMVGGGRVNIVDLCGFLAYVISEYLFG